MTVEADDPPSVDSMRAEILALRACVEHLRWFEWIVMHIHTLTDEQIKSIQLEASTYEQHQHLH